MPFRMDLWQVDGGKLVEVPSGSLDLEERLEDWLAKDSSLTGMEVLIIGRQVHTDHGGRIDLLGLDRQANTVIFELKRGRTPRDIVAQVLDYATWVSDLSYSQLDSMALGYLRKDLTAAFTEFFDEPLPGTVNSEHTLVIVAPELDESSERIVNYLAEKANLAINVVFFNCFKSGSAELLGRAWFRDPSVVEDSREPRQTAPWSGYWFVNVGEGLYRNWDDYCEYGFLAAGQGEVYSRPLQKLRINDRVFAYMRGLGYVGYGEVNQEAQMIREFVVNGKPLLDQPLQAEHSDKNSTDPKLSEWVVGIKWHRVFPRDKARTFKGAFANQNIVCKLRQPETVQFVEREFGAATADNA